MVRKPLLNEVFKLVRSGRVLRPNQAMFHVPLNYSKPQIKYYLENLYNVQVQKVETSVTLGKIKNVQTRRVQTNFKRPSIKKAYVTFEGDFYFG